MGYGFPGIIPLHFAVRGGSLDCVRELLAREKTLNYKLDRSHILAVSMFDDIEKFMKVPDEWAPPEMKPYAPIENLQQWLTDEKGRDQFVIRSGLDMEVLWNDVRQMKPEPTYKHSLSWHTRQSQEQERHRN
ncbi:Eukaryotic translation initiation factor 3 subunit B [Camellia lanceoleosa]|uniref:Eukaryotic translation initiation factor 3 subunit B n=1 Tax=Camellia lanceoleosa TaxID=1840588 RepID=A0ACC0GK15_9ERIC|nr:Eukaryotic translation initiation factor 3 subunit B [Camellia lanceoleosa]